MKKVELWKGLDFTNGVYQVSNLGRVRSVDREVEYVNYRGTICKKNYKGIIMKTNLTWAGYERVTLHHDSKDEGFMIHALVAKAFIQNDNPNRTQVNHIDGNKLNNTVENLEWVTASENQQHAQDTGLKKRMAADDRMIAFKNIDKVMVFSSVSKASKHFGVSIHKINMILRTNNTGKVNGIYANYLPLNKKELLKLKSTNLVTV